MFDMLSDCILSLLYDRIVQWDTSTCTEKRTLIIFLKKVK